jgi:peptide deformylase
MDLTLKYIGNDVLRRKAAPVSEFGDALRVHLPRMIEVMREEGGIGLAAPQVGLSQHFFIVIANVDDDEREADEIQLMANIRIIEASPNEVSIEEGCLSVPDLRFELARPEWIRIGFQDIDGNPAELHCDELLARVIQHELDHCEGILFVDRLSPAKRVLLKKRIAAIEAEYNSR